MITRLVDPALPSADETGYYLHVEDLAGALIGPFSSPESAREHYAWCKDVRGDGAALKAILHSSSPEYAALKVGNSLLKMTPGEDKADGVPPDSLN